MVSAIIQARMTSSRLPGKVLFEINGRPLLSYMLDRVKAARTVDQLIVATSLQVSDNPIAGLCQREGIPCYRGSLDDVLDRYYQAARHYKSDVIVRLTGDCPLIDPQIIDAVVRKFQAGQYDYVANDAPPDGMTYPDGMDVEVFSFKALKRAWQEAKKPSEREHVTFYFWKNPHLFSTSRYDLKENLSGYRLTVDYREDFEMIRSLMDHFAENNSVFTMKEIISFLDENPEIKAINSHIASNQGWQAALEKDKHFELMGIAYD